MELLLIIANIGTAVVVCPILRRQNESVALGYVTARIVECTFVAVGILAVLTIVTLGQETSGADAGRDRLRARRVQRIGPLRLVRRPIESEAEAVETHRTLVHAGDREHECGSELDRENDEEAAA